jgi:transcriptional regulator with XRE-family HTH domain
VTMFAGLFRRDRERSGLTVEQAARSFGVTPAAYRAIEGVERGPA